MKIKAYQMYTHAVALQPAPPGRKGDGQATIASASQRWEFVCPVAFTATWNGGSRAEDIEIRLAGAHTDGEASDPAFVQSNLGQGRLTFYPGYQLKTEGGYRLWLRGPLNTPKDGLYPLENLVDATLLPYTVTMQWQFTHPHHTIRFEAGEPFATLLLYPTAALDTLCVEVIKHEDDAEAYAQSFQQMVDNPSLHNLFQRLSTASDSSDLQSTPKGEATQTIDPLPAGCFDTIDGRIDLQHFKPGFFVPERFWGHSREVYLRRYGEIYRRDFYVIDALKLVYLSVPKVACTAIKLALAKAIGIDFEPDQDREYVVHFHSKWRREGGRLRESQSGYERFAFVRNPFDRLVSCYRGKIIFTETPKIRTPLYQDYFFSLPVNISFADFAQRVSKIPDALADSHFKSQAALLYRGDELQVDYVGKFEQLDHDWHPIAEKYQLDPRLAPTNVSKNKPGCHSDYRLYYTEPLVQLVYERYRKDIERFGYEEEYEQLLAFVRQHEQNASPGVSGWERHQEKESSRHER